MNEKQEPAQTVDIASSPSDSLDAGLAAGFGKRLDAPRSSLGDLRPVLLREAEGESSPVVKPNSDAMPHKSQSGDRYQLSGEIARGGMGAVLRGRDVDLGRDLAVKVLLEKYANRPEVARRFIEEAQIGGQLQHPGIVPVYDIGQFGDRPFFTMKLVKGQTLAAILAERKDSAMERPRLLSIALQVAQTLAYAHAKGVIHRDLKPANIMVGAFGEVQVMDWGLAKVLAEGGIADEERATRAQEQPTDVTTIRTARSTGSTGSFGTDTEAGSLLGTPAYMPPEQANGDLALIDRRADVFGIGAILCEILTGKPPYVGRSGEEVRRKAANGDLADAYALLGSCGADQELTDLTRRCLAPEAVDRPKDAQAVAEVLTVYLDGVQERLHKAEVAEAEARARAIEEAKRRRLTLALAATVFAAMTLGGGGWMWIKSERDARMAQVTREINESLNKAVSLREQAKVAIVGSADLFSQAREQTQRALALLQSGPADATQAKQVALVQADLDQEQKDRQLIVALEEARMAGAELAAGENRFAQERTVPLFRKALEEYGLPVGKGLPEVIGSRIQKKPESIRMILISCLDTWINLSESPTLGIPEPHKDWLAAVVAAAEPQDAWNQKLREANREKIVTTRRASLEKLAAEADLGKLPASSLRRLAASLDQSQAHGAALKILRSAQTRYPADFWVNQDLGKALQRPETGADFAEAVRFLTAAVALQPESPGARNNLAIALNKLGKLDEAIACCKRTIELAPTYASAHNTLGLAFHDQGKAEEAVACYRRAIELDPTEPSTHLNLGNSLCSKGDLDGAIASCRKAIELNPKFALAHSGLGTALLDKLQVEPAIASFHQSIELDPNHSMTHNNLALALNKKGQKDAAIASYRRALELDPKNQLAHRNLGIMLKELGQVDGAIRSFKKASELLPMDPADFNQVGALLKQQGKLDEAIGWYTKGIEVDPKYARLYGDLGTAFKEQGKLNEAIACYKKAIELDATIPNFYSLLGNALGDKNELDEAIASHRKALDLDARFALGHFNLGNALAKQGQLDDAITSYRKAIELDPKFASSYTNLGVTIYLKGEIDEAIAVFRKSIALDPNAANAYLNLGIALMEQRKYDEAMACHRKVIELAPKHPIAPKQLAQAQRLALARDNFQAFQSGSYTPSSSEERLGLAEWCQFKKLNHTAAGLYAAAFTADPKLADDLQGQHRYNASCHAALAAAGQSEDAAKLDDAERTRLRKQALDWLRADLGAYSKQLEAANTPSVGTAVKQRLLHWRQDGDLASIRDEAALAALPVEERQAFTQLWVDVSALFRKTSTAPEVDKP